MGKGADNIEGGKGEGQSTGKKGKGQLLGKGKEETRKRAKEEKRRE